MWGFFITLIVMKKLLIILILLISTNGFSQIRVEDIGDNWKSNADDILWFLAGKNLLSLEKDDTKYKINKRLMLEFITKEQITTEIKIILAPNTNLSINTVKNKNSFYSKDVIRKRYKNLFNSNQLKFSPIN